MICQNSEPNIGPLIDSKTEETGRFGELKEPWYDGCVKLFTRFLLTMLASLGLLGTAYSQDAEKVFAKASKSVFTIETPNSYGTGFMVAPDILVTCYHVVKGARANIRLREASGVEADYIIHNEEADIAVFRLSRRLENYLKFAEAVNVGSSIYVIGTPLGALERSITSGIVSQKYKIAGIPQLQITAPISPGSSGSPVLNKDGKVVGMAQATLREGQANNFALDYSVIKSLVPTNEASKKTETKKNEVKKPIKKYIVGTEKSIRYLRPTKLYKMPDTSSEEVWECRGLKYGQAYKTKYPNWVAVSMTDDSVSYCRAENVEFVDAKARNLNPDPFYVEEPDYFETCVKELSNDSLTTVEREQLDSYKKLTSLGVRAIYLLLEKIEFYVYNPVTKYDVILRQLNSGSSEQILKIFDKFFSMATDRQKGLLMACLNAHLTYLTNHYYPEDTFSYQNYKKDTAIFNTATIRKSIATYLTKTESADRFAMSNASILGISEVRELAKKMVVSSDLDDAMTGFWAFCGFSNQSQLGECRDLYHRLRAKLQSKSIQDLFFLFGFTEQGRIADGQVINILLDCLDDDSPEFQQFALETLYKLSETNRLKKQSESEDVFARVIPIIREIPKDKEKQKNFHDAFLTLASLHTKVNAELREIWKQKTFVGWVYGNSTEIESTNKVLNDKDMRNAPGVKPYVETYIKCSGFVKEKIFTEKLSQVLKLAPEFYEDCLASLNRQHTTEARNVVSEQTFNSDSSIRRLARQILEKW